MQPVRDRSARVFVGVFSASAVLAAGNGARADDLPPVNGVVSIGALPYLAGEGVVAVAASAQVEPVDDKPGYEVAGGLELGLAKWLSLTLAAPFESAPSDEGRLSGVGNIDIGAMFALVSDQELGVAVSLSPSVGLPAISRGVGERAVLPSLSGAVAIHFGTAALALSSTLVVQVPTTPDDARVTCDAAVSLIRVDTTLAPFIELGVALDEAVRPVAAAGLNWIPASPVVLTLAAPLTLDHGNFVPALSLSVQVTTAAWSANTPEPAAPATTARAAVATAR